MLTRPANFLIAETKEITRLDFSDMGLTQVVIAMVTNKLKNPHFVVYDALCLKDKLPRDRIPLITEVHLKGKFVYFSDKPSRYAELLPTIKSKLVAAITAEFENKN